VDLELDKVADILYSATLR